MLCSPSTICVGSEQAGESKTTALRNLWRLSKRFLSDEVYQRYKDFIYEFLNLGHMTIAPNAEEVTPNFYLPYHGVLREQSITTKLKIVFNASSRSSSGVSLNDILHSGPKLQTDLQMFFYGFENIVTFFHQISSRCSVK